MRPLVIDIYHGDPVLDAKSVEASGIIGVIHKASEYLSRDPLYQHRKNWFKSSTHCLWGAYHFYHGGGAKEADFFLQIAGLDAGDLAALDWEQNPGGYTPSAHQAREFLERVEEKLGRKAVIYSGNAAKEQIHGSDSYFGSHRLWLAQYGSHWSVQESWHAPWLWQNNGDGDGPGPHHIPGIGGNCDNSTIVVGSPESLRAEWSGGIAPTSMAPLLQSGRASVYSQFVGRYHWHDPEDAPNSNALGVSDSAQGISLYSHHTLGRWFLVEAPNGRRSVEQQTDIGPAPWTGKAIDISAAAAERFGYSPQDFPTGGVFHWEEVDPPVSVAGLPPREAARRYQEVRNEIAGP